jgi:hypothetical protein
MPNWTMDNLDGPPDFTELRRELRRAYVESMQYLAFLRRMRAEIDASTPDHGKRLTKRLHTMDYRMALEDYNDAANRVFVFGGMIGAELTMQARIEEVRARRATPPPSSDAE